MYIIYGYYNFWTYVYIFPLSLLIAKVGSEQLIASPLRVDDGAPGFAARALVDEEHRREAVTVYKAGLGGPGVGLNQGSHPFPMVSHGLTWFRRSQWFCLFLHFFSPRFDVACGPLHIGM